MRCLLALFLLAVCVNSFAAADVKAPPRYCKNYCKHKFDAIKYSTGQFFRGIEDQFEYFYHCESFFNLK